MPAETTCKMTKERKVIATTIPLDSGFTHLLLNIAAQGYAWIEVEYSGGGDYGAIDTIELIPTGALDIEDGEINWHDDQCEKACLEENLQEHVEDFAHSKILSNADDWWNNDGGGGILYISTLDGSYHGNHYVNVTETIDSVLTGKLGDY
jgi:hypothetical protein